ncbi:MAG: response regulator, partial [Anaerolinea sp.]|nr:response regulator [Anaerolinea sp.]
MTTSRQPLVLVADDDLTITIMLRHVFEKQGFQVVHVDNGTAALNTARDRLPDLILLDILMPEMNGFEVLRLLREDKATASIPTILITANARTPSDVVKGMDLGANDYLHKPFSPQELLARAQSKIRARQLEEALERRTNELEMLLTLSETLNEDLTKSEVVRTIAEFAKRMIDADLVAVAYLTADDQIGGSHIISRQEPQPVISLKNLFELCDRSGGQLVWDAPNSPVPGYDAGCALILQQNEQLVGLLLAACVEKAFDDNHRRLLEGIARQAALALHNARLYELQTRYAQTLEMHVAERTRELERAQKLLLRSEKLASIGHLAASIAHEINNPLMPIRNLLEEIVDELTEKGVDFDRHSVAIIQNSLERIRGIVSRLLEFARDPGSDLASVDISAVIRGVLELNRKFFEHSRIQIITQLPRLPLIMASKDQLEQVFMNLALNAQAAMADGGTLTVTARQDASEIVITFSDTGCGISPDHVERIFDPFFSTKPNGTGLGLFVSHGIIQAHNGKIEVESELGIGTTFTIRLP